jgi:hypothetical protein
MEEQIKASEMKTLNKTMVQYVLEKMNNTKPIDFVKAIHEINNYAKFLSTPLSLGMFIPTDEDGNVLEEPEYWKNFLDYSDRSVVGLKQEIYDYYDAKERVLFEGFEICKVNNEMAFRVNGRGLILLSEHKTIEDLIKYNLTLTENALKNIL